MAQATILGTDLVKDALKTKTNDNFTETYGDITALETEVHNARNSTVTSTNHANLDARLEANETAMAVLSAGSGTTVSANDAVVGTLYGTNGTDGKVRVSGDLSIAEGNNGGDEYITITNTYNTDANLKSRFLL